MELVFGVDTKHRKEWFTGISFSHPAKMSLPLQLWIIENYTKPGDTILDAMAGSGTVLVACSLGRNVIAVELEPKFVEIMKGNWEKIKQRGPQLGYSMGQAQILQGDARKLENILADHAIFSPPYADNTFVSDFIPPHDSTKLHHSKYAPSNNNIGNLKYGDITEALNQGNRVFVDCGQAFFDSPSLSSQGKGMKIRASFSSKLINKFQHQFSVFPLDIEEWNKLRQELFKVNVLGHSTHIDQFATDRLLPSDPIIELREIFTNPFACLFVTDSNLETGAKPSILVFPLFQDKETPLAINQACQISQFNSIHQRNSNINNAVCQTPYGDIDSIITSPPYEASISGESHTEEARAKEFDKLRAKGYKINPNSADNKVKAAVYSRNGENIGNLKADSYLSAMLQVYEQCYRVLRPGGFMVLVTKNFIRDKKEVHLDADTIRLCEAAGFLFVERHYRKLPAQSFWRVIYRQRYPEAPVIDKEDILVFRRG